MSKRPSVITSSSINNVEGQDKQKKDNPISSISHRKRPPQFFLFDTSPVELPVVDLLLGYVFSSVILTAFSISSIISRYLLAGLVTFLIPPWIAGLLGSIVLPVVIYMAHRMPPETYRPGKLTLWGCAAGILVGSSLSHLTVSSEPFVPLTSFSVIAACAFIGKWGSAQNKSWLQRDTILVVVGTSSLTAHLTIGAMGMLVSGPLTPTYFLLTGIYTLIGLVPVQMSAQRGMMDKSLVYALVTVTLTVVTKCLIYWMFGVELVTKRHGE